MSTPPVVTSISDKKYQIIYADPPWTYRDKALAGARGAGCKYQLLSKFARSTISGWDAWGNEL